MAWKCQNCSMQIEEVSFEVCWNCGCERGQVKPPESTAQALKCLRCDSVTIELGSKEFHEGTRWGAIGNLGEWFVDKQALDMFVCESCGKVEFFLPRTGQKITRHFRRIAASPVALMPREL